MKLVAIGFLGEYVVYVDMTREDAMARYDRENPDYTIAENDLVVKEIDVRDGRFQVYEIEEDNDADPGRAGDG